MKSAPPVSIASISSSLIGFGLNRSGRSSYEMPVLSGAAKADFVAIFLHGLGATNGDLESLSSMFGQFERRREVH